MQLSEVVRPQSVTRANKLSDLLRRHVNRTQEWDVSSSRPWAPKSLFVTRCVFEILRQMPVPWGSDFISSKFLLKEQSLSGLLQDEGERLGHLLALMWVLNSSCLIPLIIGTNHDHYRVLQATATGRTNVPHQPWAPPGLGLSPSQTTKKSAWPRQTVGKATLLWLKSHGFKVGGSGLEKLQALLQGS